MPRISNHRGYAQVKLGGRAVHLGVYGSPEAAARYDEAVGAFLSTGRTPAVLPGTLDRLAQRYAAFAASYFRKGDRPTSSLHITRRALELAFRFHGPARVSAYGPAQLKAFRTWLAADPAQRFGRKTINEYVRVIQSMFAWAASEELLPPGRWIDLAAVKPLRRGRPADAGGPPPRDGEPIRPVPEAILRATLAAARPMLRAMMELQLATGMRPGELLALRPADLTPTVRDGVWCYRVRPDANKTEHAGRERLVYIGPRGLAALRPWLPADPEAFVFSPARALEEWNASRVAARVTPRQPSQALGVRRRRRPKGSGPGERYTTDSYRRAITRACDAAFPHPLAGRRGLTPEQAEELRRWREKHRWHPHQLRHNAATFIAEHEALDVAQLLLGHSSIATTLRYVKVADHRAALAALRHG